MKRNGQSLKKLAAVCTNYNVNAFIAILRTAYAYYMLNHLEATHTWNLLSNIRAEFA